MNQIVRDDAINVLGSELEPCSLEPLTGFFRDGCCNTCSEDTGSHTVCVEVTAEFLEYSRFVGNDLSSPTGSGTDRVSSSDPGSWPIH